MTPFFENDRIILRQFTINDASFILSLFNSHEWLKFIGDRNIKSHLEAIEYLENNFIKIYKQNEIGFWCVQLKANNLPIGMCGLIKRKWLDNVDIGFAFLSEYNGYGYAYESAVATLNFAFNVMKEKKVLGITLPNNSSAIKLLEKIGMRFNSIILNPETHEELLLFSIENFNK